MGNFVRDVIDRLQPVIQASGCGIALHTEADVAGHWDPFRIEQALNNLINNACRYAPSCMITVEVRQDAPNTVTLIIADNGPGVAAHDQDRIFSRFERAISANERSGLGLGLYVVRQIADTHGGRVTLTSEPGKGCTFCMTLPTDDEHSY